MPHATKSALLGAREGFLAGLARRGEALRPVVYRFIANPTGRVVRAELQRRLHSLLASAQLFEEAVLVARLQRLTARLDAVGLGGESWQQADSDLLLSLLQSLCPPNVPDDSQRPLPLTAAAPQPRRAPVEAWDATAQLGAVLLVRVLLVCSRPHAAALRALLDDAPLELLHAADPEQALSLLEQATPACALIAAEFAMLPDIDLVGRLRAVARPLEAIYLMLPEGASYDADFLRQTGADGVLIEPITWELLGPLLERTSAPLTAGDAAGQPEYPPEVVRDSTELPAAGGHAATARALATEAHTDAAAQSAFARAKIERVRAQLSELAREPTSDPPPSWIPPRPKPVAAASAVTIHPTGRGSLSGTTILVVDDDPAMLWFFSGVVRDAGAAVLQARDGVEAVALAERYRPQLVLCDILMPKLDGFALRRALQRQPALERTPVLLLSWKGDALERARANTQDAAVVLRKEASVPEVLAAAERALAPRRRIERALAGLEDVSGRVEEVGIVVLLECVVAARSDVRITVEDGVDLYEVDIGESLRLGVTRTATHGSFARGVRALFPLLGVTSGRFQVSARAGQVRNPLPAALPVALQSVLGDLSAAIEGVSSERIERVARVTLDDDILSSALHDAPALERVVSRLRRLGMSPQRMLLEGASERPELETCLFRLARCGAISGMWGADGEDCLAAAWRSDAPGVEELRSASRARSVPSLPPRSTVQPAADAAAQLRVVEGDRIVADRVGAKVSADANASAETAHVPVSADEALEASADSSQRFGHGGVTEGVPGIGREPESIDPLDQLDGVEGLWPVETDPSAHAGRGSTQPTAATGPAAAGSAAAADIVPLGAARVHEATGTASFAVADEHNHALDLRTLEAPPADLAVARKRRREGVQLMLTLAASATLGYLGALQIETHPALLGNSVQVIGTRGLSMQLMAADGERETSMRSGLDPSAGLGTVLPYIDTTRGVPVGSDEGLVIFEYVGAAPPPRLEIDDRPLGFAPLAVALAAKPHQLKLRFAGDAILRTLTVRAGETRVITLPLSKP